MGSSMKAAPQGGTGLKVFDLEIKDYLRCLKSCLLYKMKHFKRLFLVFLLAVKL